MKKALIFLPLIALVLAGYSCQTTPAKQTQNAIENQAGLANPASVYCQENDGRLDIRTNEDGSQTGFCIFTDGSECEEWSYYRGECQAKKQTDVMVSEIKQLFVQKYNKPQDEVTVIINQQIGDYARGGVKFGKDGIGEGGIFLAAKVEGKWKIVFDGNGIIPCHQLESYNFPDTMIPDCLK